MKNKGLLNHKELASFCKQMAMILDSGLSTIEGISLMMEDCKEDEKVILENIYQDLLEIPFSSALKKQNIFPDYMIQMIEIGEETGRNDEVMKALYQHYLREDALSQSIKNALTYPMVMISMMLIVIFILLTKVMPLFNQVFQQLGQEMTGLSKGLLVLGNSLSQFISIFIVIIVLLVLLIIYLLKSKKGKQKLNHFLAYLPFTKSLFFKISMCHFASGLALALKSGLVQERSIDLAKELVDNDTFLTNINQAKREIDEGQSMSNAFSKNHLFTGIQSRMILIAEKTGQIDQIMDDIANQLEEEIDDQISSFINILEPTLVIILSIIVGIILLSVMLPLLGIMSSI